MQGSPGYKDELIFTRVKKTQQHIDSPSRSLLHLAFARRVWRLITAVRDRPVGLWTVDSEPARATDLVVAAAGLCVADQESDADENSEQDEFHGV